jgi:hypothetical protein
MHAILPKFLPVFEVLPKHLPGVNQESHELAVRIVGITAGHFVNQATPTPSYLFLCFMKAKMEN